MISNEEAFKLLKHEINNAIQSTEHKTLAEWPDLRSALKIMGKALTPVDVVDQAYTERNIAVSLLALVALRLGYKAGIGKDNNEDWEDEWRNVVYVDLPSGQVSYHIAPHDMECTASLPEYKGKWDGSFNSKDITFPLNESVDTPVDVESLKKDVPEISCDKGGMIYKTGYNQAIDDLNAQGLITGKLPYIQGLEEAVYADHWRITKHFYTMEKAAEAYLERMEDKSDGTK